MEHDARFPASLDELLQFASAKDDYQRNPLLKKEDLIDPWGEPFAYERSENGRKYILRSSGPDRIMGTADDFVEGYPPSYVTSWKAKQTPPVDGQGTNAVQAAAQTGGTASPSLAERWFGKRREGAVPGDGGAAASPPGRLWLYAVIALCVLPPVLYLLRRKLKTGK
jgi:hypothetical protein